MNQRAQRGLLPSAVRSATTACPQMQDRHSNTARLYLNVTAASGTGGLTLQLRGYDKESGSSAVIFADPNAITATGLYVFELGPAVGAADAHRRAVLNAFLPVVWDVNIAAGDSSTYTYSLSAETSTP